jgi:type VI secretion system protein ImpM
MLDSQATLGIFGKIPARGDFFRRRLPRIFLDPWDAWLGSAINQSRTELGDGWLGAFLTSPIWRFALACGVCGESPVAGILMPSVDSVNRHFPLTLASLLPAPCSPFAVAADGGWFVKLEELALACLRERLDPETIEAHLSGIAGPHVAVSSPSVSAPASDCSTLERSWRYDPAAPGFFLERLCPATLDEMFKIVIGAYSLWWTSGSDLVEPVVRVYRGLPLDGEFASFLTKKSPQPTATASSR